MAEKIEFDEEPVLEEWPNSEFPSNVRFIFPAADDVEKGRKIDSETATIEEKRALVFRMYIQRNTMQEIVKKTGIGLATVHRYIHHVLESYRRISLKDAHFHIATGIAQQQEVLDELWKLYRESDKPEVTEEASSVPNRVSGARVTRTKVTRKTPKHKSEMILMQISVVQKRIDELKGLVAKERQPRSTDDAKSESGSSDEEKPLFMPPSSPVHRGIWDAPPASADGGFI